MNNRIKAIRLKLKLTQKQFAKAIGISPAALSQIENNKIPISDSIINSLFNILIVDGSQFTPMKESTNDLVQRTNTTSFPISVEEKVSSYLNELLAKKKGAIFIVLQNIKGIKDRKKLSFPMSI